MNTTILAIDDERFYLGMINFFLSNADYNIITIEGGYAGIDYLNHLTHPLDAILLDLMMPDLHGLDVLYFIKNHPTLKYIPVIIQTATPNEDEIDRGLALGASTCIRKPYTVMQLLNVIAGVLQ